MAGCDVIRYIVVCGYLIGSLSSSAQAEGTTSRPNIILCMADDQGWGDVGYAGHPVLKTPNLNAMAAAGLRFDRFYAAAPVCSPTRGSVMTGRHPNRYGCFKWGYPLRPQEMTIAEILKASGYVTGHFGKWHLGSAQKSSPVNPGAKGFDEWLSAPNFFDNDPILSREGIAVRLKGESSMVTMEAAIEFIRKHAKEPRPFFAVVWFGSPHTPHKASHDTFARYPDQTDKLRHYYGEISGIDDAIGKLRHELRELGIQDNTILWYCSDNGGVANVSVTGGRGHKGMIYEGGLRVPAMIEWPARISKRTVTNVPASTSDIFPTLVEITGAQFQTRVPLDGISLFPLMEGQIKTRPKPIGFWSYPARGIRTPTKTIMTALVEAQSRGDEVGDKASLCLDAGKITKQYSDKSFPGHAAWLDWPWKYHRIEGNTGTVKTELYNLADDPKESSDQSTQQKDRAKAMRAELERWLASVVASLNGKDY